MGSSLETENSIGRFVISMLGNVRTASPMNINLRFHYEQGDSTIQNGGEKNRIYSPWRNVRFGRFPTQSIHSAMVID